MSGQDTANTATGPYGRRLFLHIVDEKARTSPDQEVFSVPKTARPEDGWKPVSWKAFANSINHIARRFIEVSGTPAEGSFPTVAYIGPNDARYITIVLAGAKAGYKVLFISPRNSQEGQMSLFDKTDCNIIAYARSHRDVVQPWLHERHMQAVEVRALESWFPNEDVPHFPYNKTFEQAEWEPLMVLHTSGSTGIPKPIVVSNGMLAIGDAFHNLPEWNGRKTWMQVFGSVSKRALVPMPLFHAAGLYTFLLLSFYYEQPVALPIPDKPLSSDLIRDTLNHVDVECALIPPAILEDMSQDASCIESLKKLKSCTFGGGNLVTEAGNRLVKNGVKLNNMVSATEFTPFPYYFQDNTELWRYFIINSDLFGADWQKSGEENVYKLVIKRKDKAPGIQGFFYTFPDDDEYDTKDLYTPHPTLPDHWVYYGRSDDVLVFSNGEKLNPVSIEAIVGDHPKLKGALVVGAQRFQPALIIEPFEQPASEQEAKELIDSVWPLVVQANKETVAHGQIGRPYIAVARPDMPFLRAGKGTVQRAGTVNAYKEVIDDIYARAGELSSTDVPRIDVSSEQALVECIEAMFVNNLGSGKLDHDSDFFSSGVDSLQVINASRLLRAGLEGAGHSVDATAVATRVIYGNPTPRRLAQYILSVVGRTADRGSGSAQPEGSDADHEIQAMRALWDKYTHDLPRPAAASRPEAADEGQTVLLTGSTGMLGSYMLDLLVRSPRVARVVCLNRADDGGARRQAASMAERGLAGAAEGLAAKVEFHHADMSRSDFGVPRDVMARLLASADRVVHNAWPVNFNIPVESFAPHLRSVRNIGDFAAAAAKRVAVAFISSIGTADMWDSDARGPVPEKRLDDLALATTGYGRSKMVGGLILDDAAAAGDFPAAVIRVGQIAGPEGEKGAWNRQEWFPSIIASSVHMGALPAQLAVMEKVDWTPVENIAKLVLEVIGATQRVAPSDITGYYHGVNPQETTWARLAPAVQEFYGKERIPRLVSFGEWTQLLAKSQSDDTSDIEKNPGVKLLDFYRDLNQGYEAGAKGQTFDMTSTKKRSPTMRNTQAVSPDIMKHWCAQWAYV